MEQRELEALLKTTDSLKQDEQTSCKRLKTICSWLRRLAEESEHPCPIDPQRISVPRPSQQSQTPAGRAESSAPAKPSEGRRTRSTARAIVIDLTDDGPQDMDVDPEPEMDENASARAGDATGDGEEPSLELSGEPKQQMEVLCMEAHEHIKTIAECDARRRRAEASVAELTDSIARGKQRYTSATRRLALG